MPHGSWGNAGVVPTRKWTCGFCGLAVSSDKGYQRTDQHFRDWLIHPCPSCDKPTFFMGDSQVPGAAFGSRVGHLPADVEGLYDEARNCMVVSAYTASVLTTRKLLMNVSVVLGAPSNQSFLDYVNFLSSGGYVPTNSKGWVDHIRKKANEATHEIPAVGRADAEDLLTFMEMILKIVFEFPNRVPGHGATGS